MSWDFDYVKAWRELAMPLFEALPEERKQLVMDTCLAVAEHRQNKALHIDWPEGDAGVELRRRFHEVPQAELAAMSRIVYFLGHWLPGQEEWDKIEPGLSDSVRPYVRRGPPEGTFKISHQVLHLWKFSNLADQVLRGRLGMDPQRKFDTGCGNHGCIVSPPKGAGTNAGCRCHPGAFARALRQLADVVERDGDWVTVRRVRPAAARQREVNAAYLMGIVDRVYEALCDGKARIWQDRAQAAAEAAEALGRTCRAVNERRDR